MSLFRQFAMGPCFYCNQPTYRLGPSNNHPQKYTRDHLVPVRLRKELLHVSVQKKVTWVVRCCLRCNSLKGNRTAYSFLEELGIKDKQKWSVINRAYALVGLGPLKAQKSLARELQQ